MLRTIRRLLDLFVVLILVLMALTCSITLTASYGGLHASRRATMQLMTALRTDIRQGLKKDVKAEDIVRDSCSRLDAAAKSTLDSNSMAFLFQVFSLVIVTVGGFILLQMLRLKDSASDKIDCMARFARSLSSLTLYGYVSSNRQYAFGLESREDRLSNAQLAILPELRVMLRRTKSELNRASRAELAIDRPLRELMRDWAADVTMILRELPEDQVGDIRDMTDMANQITVILDQQDFSERYEELMSQLSR